MRPGESEAEAGVFVATFRTGAYRRARGPAVERVTTDAMKRRFSARQVKAPVIAPVIPEPDADKHGRDYDAIDDNGGGEIKHAQEMGGPAPDPQQKPRGRTRPARPKKTRRRSSRRVGLRVERRKDQLVVSGAGAPGVAAGAAASAAGAVLAFLPFADFLPFDFL